MLFVATWDVLNVLDELFAGTIQEIHVCHFFFYFFFAFFGFFFFFFFFAFLLFCFGLKFGLPALLDHFEAFLRACLKWNQLWLCDTFSLQKSKMFVYKNSVPPICFVFCFIIFKNIALSPNNWCRRQASTTTRLQQK